MTSHIRNKNSKAIVQWTKNITGFKSVTELMRFMMDDLEDFADYDGIDYVIEKISSEYMI